MVVPLVKAGSYGESRRVINPNQQAFCYYELNARNQSPK